MLQSVHDCKKFYWGTKWVPAELVIGGDQPFVRRLIGFSISPMVGSIYNMGVWDKVAAAWVKADVRRTLEGEAVARRHYRETGLSLENGGVRRRPAHCGGAVLGLPMHPPLLHGHGPPPSGLHGGPPRGPSQGQWRGRGVSEVQQ